MMKKIRLTFLLASLSGFSQVCINTETSKLTLDVVHKSTINVPAGMIIPILKGDELKANDNFCGTDQNRVVVYVTSGITSSSNKTAMETKRFF